MNDVGAVKKNNGYNRQNKYYSSVTWEWGTLGLILYLLYVSREGEETSTNVQGHNVYTRTAHHHSTLTQTKQGITAFIYTVQSQQIVNKKFLDSVYK